MGKHDENRLRQLHALGAYGYGYKFTSKELREILGYKPGTDLLRNFLFETGVLEEVGHCLPKLYKINYLKKHEQMVKLERAASV